MKKLKITVNGKIYDVVVESLDEPGGHAAPVLATPRAASVVAAPTSSAPTSSAGPAGPGAIVSPLAGRVVSIDCAAGSKVESGQTIITLEAMKMNTLIHANHAGTVSKILVAAGDAVEEGQTLAIVDP